jgi:hypothetical protein
MVAVQFSTARLQHLRGFLSTSLAPIQNDVGCIHAPQVAFVINVVCREPQRTLQNSTVANLLRRYLDWFVTAFARGYNPLLSLGLADVWKCDIVVSRSPTNSSDTFQAAKGVLVWR